MSTTLKGELIMHIAPKSDAMAARLCFKESDTGRILPISKLDHLVIRDAKGNVAFSGTTNLDYTTNQTIINAQQIGQLFPWPEGSNYQGYAFVYGAPENIPADVWLWAVLKNWPVMFTPNPRLLADNEAGEGELLVSGVLEPFFETGTEGVVWSVYDPRKRGYEGLNQLQNGDHLTVYEPDGVTIRWKGVVRLEYKRNYRPYPMNPKYGQQEVLGYWVHGLQRTLEPEAWARMFFDGLPCLLRRKPKRCKAGKKSGKPNTCGSCACDKQDK